MAKSNGIHTFYHAYGRAMAQWALLEHVFCGEFQRFTGLSGEMGADVFFSARSFRARAEMLLACVPHVRTTPQGRTYFTKMIAIAREYAKARNSLAHDLHVQWVALSVGKVTDGRAIQHRRGLLKQSHLETAEQNFNNLQRTISASRRYPGKRLKDPELSLALLGLLSGDALDPAPDQSAIDALLSELQHLSG